MTELEIRYFIDDFNSFLEKLKLLGFTKTKRYFYRDHYFLHPKLDWNYNLKNIRIREYIKPKKKSEIIFTINKIKNFQKFSIKEGYKVKLYKGSFKNCEKILIDMGFKKFATIEKSPCTIFENKKLKFSTAVEYIPEIGYWGEIELNQINKESIKKIKEFLKAMKIEKIYSQTLLEIYLLKTKNSSSAGAGI